MPVNDVNSTELLDDYLDVPRSHLNVPNCRDMCQLTVATVIINSLLPKWYPRQGVDVEVKL